jgi:hypothetical protein
MYPSPYPYAPTPPLAGQAGYYQSNRKCPYCDGQLMWYTNYPASASNPRPDMGRFFCPGCQRYY